MSHTHTMEGKLKAEMSVKPSALWQHRPVSLLSLCDDIQTSNSDILSEGI